MPQDLALSEIHAFSTTLKLDERQSRVIGPGHQEFRYRAAPMDRTHLSIAIEYEERQQTFTKVYVFLEGVPSISDVGIGRSLQ